jgi:hypothetical protein
MKLRSTGVRQSVSETIAALDQMKTIFQGREVRRKAALLKRLAAADMIRAADLETYHDLLCFFRAYPDSPDQLSRVERELFQFATRVERYKQRSRDASAGKLADSGIVNTSVSNTFSYDLTRAIARWYPRLVDIGWDEYNESDSANALAFLPLFVSWQENDSIDNDPNFDVESWLRAGLNDRTGNTLTTLLRLLTTSGVENPIARTLFEIAEIPIQWTLTNCPASRTLRRLPAKKLFFQKEPPAGRTSDLRRDLGRKARPLTHLPRTEGETYVRAIKEVLGVRCRELFPLIGSNPAEVYRYLPGRGVEIIIFGANPNIRLPLEANCGAMLLRNGMPIGYGVSALLFDRAEIAINVFPSFRSGESSFMIENYFHLFVKHFGSRVLLVRSYQVGDDNEEAIDSGAFWFYYKLGFRPVKKRVRDLAAGEARKVVAQPGYRTPKPMLRRLAKSDIYFHLEADQMDGYAELSLPNLGYAVGYFIRDHFGGDRRAAETGCVKRLVRLLDIGDLRRWSADERTALERMAPLVCCIPDLAKWSKGERRLLARLIRAKGSTLERQYVRLTLEHPRFYHEMQKLAKITRPPVS